MAPSLDILHEIYYVRISTHSKKRARRINFDFQLIYHLVIVVTFWYKSLHSW